MCWRRGVFVGQAVGGSEIKPDRERLARPLAHRSDGRCQRKGLGGWQPRRPWDNVDVSKLAAFQQALQS